VRSACAKRPISQETIEELVTTVEKDVFALGKAEVDSIVIGKMTMEQLRALDDVAYVRFASVYRRFKDVDGLVEEINEFRKWQRLSKRKRPRSRKKS
jgi:transcriptional repressor NrdR